MFVTLTDLDFLSLLINVVRRFLCFSAYPRLHVSVTVSLTVEPYGPIQQKLRSVDASSMESPIDFSVLWW